MCILHKRAVGSRTILRNKITFDLRRAICTDPSVMSNVVAELRKVANLSHEEIGKRLHVHRTTVMRWERKGNKKMPAIAAMVLKEWLAEFKSVQS